MNNEDANGMGMGKRNGKRRNRMFDEFPIWDNHVFNQLMNDLSPEIELHQKVEKTKGRPINRGYLKDELGNITNILLETVYTPFKKEDVKLSVSDDVLTIDMGKDAENTNLAIDDIEYDCRCISKKAVEMKFKLVGDIDQDGINADAVDGVLTINIPIREEEIQKVREIKLK